jgi:putative nucleotidyltransferase with HDIG domain
MQSTSLIKAWSVSILTVLVSSSAVALAGPHLSSGLVWLGLAVAAFLSGAVAVKALDGALGQPRRSPFAPEVHEQASGSSPQARLRTSKALIGVESAALLVTIALIPLSPASWDVDLFLTLLTLSIASDLMAVPVGLSVSGSFLALVLAMGFLGGGPAAVIGLATILAGWIRWRDELHYLLSNLLTYALFPLCGGLLFHAWITDHGLGTSDPQFYVSLFVVFWLALVLNFILIASYGCYVERSSFISKLRSLPPVLPAELAGSVVAAGIAYVYVRIGLSALALFFIVLIVYEYLLGLLFLARQRGEELEIRSKQLASFQLGILSSTIRTLDLRDQRTARHSAAVARYSRAIAQRAGLPPREQEFVHIAALLHDIGKYAFPDRILKAEGPVTEEDWPLIQSHVSTGAKLLSSLDGYGPIAEIVLSHHERIDGAGYPRGLFDDEIPEAARIISVADAYDVMTARDSYATPMPSHQAIVELKRVAGTQLDGRFVSIFVELLEGRDSGVRQHAEAADFERELERAAERARAAAPSSDALGGFPRVERGLLVTRPA